MRSYPKKAALRTASRLSVCPEPVPNAWTKDLERPKLTWRLITWVMSDVTREQIWGQQVKGHIPRSYQTRNAPHVTNGGRRVFKRLGNIASTRSSVVCAWVCLDVNQGGTNRNRCTQRLVSLHSRTTKEPWSHATKSTLRVKIASRKKWTGIGILSQLIRTLQSSLLLKSTVYKLSYLLTRSFMLLQTATLKPLHGRRSHRSWGHDPHF